MNSANSESLKTEPKKKLRLTVEVDGIWADDLDESAAIVAEFRDRPPTDADRLFVVTEEWMRPDVILTLCNYPGEKCQNHEFEMLAYNARIVGAEAVDR